MPRVMLESAEVSDSKGMVIPYSASKCILHKRLVWADHDEANVRCTEFRIKRFQLKQLLLT